jgi:hypothetical protein
MDKINDFWKNRFNAWTALDKPARISEILFGLIMVLTFTGSISVSTAGKQEVRELLWAALGCNIAWGLADAIMYLMDEIIGRAHGISQMKKIIGIQKHTDRWADLSSRVPHDISRGPALHGL